MALPATQLSDHRGPSSIGTGAANLLDNSIFGQK